MQQRDLFSGVFYQLWDVYNTNDKQKKRVAFQLIRIIGTHSQQNLLLGRKDNFFTEISRLRDDFILVREAILIY
jgi:hypothetical protein